MCQLVFLPSRSTFTISSKMIHHSLTLQLSTIVTIKFSCFIVIRFIFLPYMVLVIWLSICFPLISILKIKNRSKRDQRVPKYLSWYSLLPFIQKIYDYWRKKKKPVKCVENRLISFYLVSCFHHQLNCNGTVVGTFQSLTQTILLIKPKKQNKTEKNRHQELFWKLFG